MVAVFGELESKLSIYTVPWSKLNHHDHEHLISNLVNDSPVTDANSIESLVACQLSTSRRSWLCGQCVYGRFKATA
jgi:hypothetical protein